MINAVLNQRVAAAAAFEHQYIAPLTVIDVRDASTFNQQPTLALATPRYENRDILRFCIQFPNVSRLKLVGPTVENFSQGI